MDPALLIPIIAIAGVFGVPITAIITSHRRQVLEMQMKLRNEGDASVRASVEALRQEVQQLKDTTLQYDLSFDNALQRMDQRVEGLERRVTEISSTQGTNNQVVTLGRME